MAISMYTGRLDVSAAVIAPSTAAGTASFVAARTDFAVTSANASSSALARPVECE